jgi:formate dehydrogenase accessory protein FdhE
LSPASEPLAVPSPAVWNERQRRAIKLLARQPQAAPLLEFLIDLLDLQRELFVWTGQQTWPHDVQAPPEEYPRIRLDRLSWERLGMRFEKFLADVGPRATDVLAELAQLVQSKHTELRRRLLETWLAGQDLESLAGEIGADARALEFFPRAFMQPVAEYFSARLGAAPEAWKEAFCPHCGRLPQLALLRDETEIKGRHLLECSLCRAVWPFRRAVCPQCGESQPEHVQFHDSEEHPHVRLGECQTCRAYLKTIDMRKNGLAVPLVEEIATVELDLWADEQGLWKLQPNVLGL